MLVWNLTWLYKCTNSLASSRKTCCKRVLARVNGFGQTVSPIQVATFVRGGLTLLVTGTLRMSRVPPRLPLVERLRDAGRLVESVIPPQEEALLADFLLQILRLDPADRPTATVLLSHPWLNLSH